MVGCKGGLLIRLANFVAFHPGAHMTGQAAGNLQKGYPPDGGLEKLDALKAVAFVIGTQSCDFQGFFHARIVKKDNAQAGPLDLAQGILGKRANCLFRNICGLEGCGRLFGIDCDRGWRAVNQQLDARQVGHIDAAPDNNPGLPHHSVIKNAKLFRGAYNDRGLGIRRENAQTGSHAGIIGNLAFFIGNGDLDPLRLALHLDKEKNKKQSQQAYQRVFHDLPRPQE